MSRRWGTNLGRNEDPDSIHVVTRDHGAELVVLADVPGDQDPNDIDLYCDGDVVHLRVASQQRTTDERIDLPARVDEESASASLNNGVLEVTFDKVDPG